MGVVKAAIADAALTSLWVFSMPFLRIFTVAIAKALGVQAFPLVGLFITTIVVTVLVFTFSVLGSILGGASFNPSTTVSFHAAGLKSDSFLSMAVKFPAQAAGGVAGVKTILQVMPEEYRHVLQGPSLKVDLHTGAAAEGIMSFVLSLAVLVIMLRGPKNTLLKVYMLAVTTVGMVVAGAKYTGPSLNPANAFGWAYVNNWHNTWELYYVYWICPFLGAVSAAWVFRLLFPAPVAKEKKA